VIDHGSDAFGESVMEVTVACVDGGWMAIAVVKGAASSITTEVDQSFVALTGCHHQSGH